MSELAMTTGLQTRSESFFAPLNSVEVNKSTTTYPILNNIVQRSQPWVQRLGQLGPRSFG
jgi:hypothetical protein